MTYFVSLFLLAQSVIELPQLGWLPGRDGRDWPLYGVRANFVLGKAVAGRPRQEEPAARSIVREDGRQWLVERTKSGEVRTALPDDYTHALDSKGALWSAKDAEVVCRSGERWTTPEPVIGFVRLNFGWMAIQTQSATHAARCGDPELYLLPVPQGEVE